MMDLGKLDCILVAVAGSDVLGVGSDGNWHPIAQLNKEIING